MFLALERPQFALCLASVWHDFNLYFLFLFFHGLPCTVSLQRVVAQKKVHYPQYLPHTVVAGFEGTYSSLMSISTDTDNSVLSLT